MIKQSELIKERVKNVMISDRSRNVEKVIRVLRSDVYDLLKDYFNLQSEDLNIKIEQGEDGYCVKIIALTDRILDCGNILE